MKHYLKYSLLILYVFGLINASYVCASNYEDSFARITYVESKECVGGKTFTVNAKKVFNDSDIRALKIYVSKGDVELMRFYAAVHEGVSSFCLPSELVQFAEIYLSYGGDPCEGYKITLKAMNLDSLKINESYYFKSAF